MQRLKQLLALVLLYLCLVACTILAQEPIQGELTGSLDPGIYIVIGEIRVPIGQLLIINPGTTFLHNGHHIWLIQGELQAIGTQDQPIIFTREQPSEYHKWKGLRFTETSSGSSILEWCEINYCKNMSPPFTRGGAIYIDNTGITLRNCTITNCEAEYGSGIYATSANSLFIDGCTIAFNIAGLGAGIYLIDTQDATVANCIIRNNMCYGC
jgi:hypothetical protein